MKKLAVLLIAITSLLSGCVVYDPYRDGGHRGIAMANRIAAMTVTATAFRIARTRVRTIRTATSR
jgi:hypothetical protein